MDTKRTLIASLIATLACLSSVNCEKYRVCVVDGRGSFRKAARYCPVLDGPDSRVECVIGIDRLDCLRKIAKRKADFSVFTPEDLVTATHSQIEVLITNELKFTSDAFEYEVVAVMKNSSGIRNLYDLRDKRLCHPGYGYETDWTRILSNYLEATVVPQPCNPSLSLTENRISASSDYFKSACKAGPWVNDPILDNQLKKKYPNLCKSCDLPTKCSMQDKYWGRRGPLYCLTDGAGDISWARLDDVKSHFGLVPGAAETIPDGYSLLCADGSLVPVNTTKPCVWVVKPWPVIATQRTIAQDIQEFMSTISHIDNNSWQSALLNLIETYHVTIEKVDPIEAIESYLARAPGFLSANSFPGCHPPRTIKICTTSNLENAKCSWLRDAAAVYGVEPDIDCVKADNKTHCMEAVNRADADLVMVPPDLVNAARSKYNLQTLFYETVADDDKYITIAVVKAHSDIITFNDFQGKKACFPKYDGIAWNTVVHALSSRNLLKSCPYDNGIAEFFGDSCVPELLNNHSISLKKGCKGDIYNGEFGAMRCLTQGGGDIAFISSTTFEDFFKNANEKGTLQLEEGDFRKICPRKTKPCHLSWAPVGQAMIRKNISNLWIKDSFDVFLQMDNLFGKNFKSVTSPFTLFGLYDGKPNVLFHDSTIKLRDLPTVKNTDMMIRQYNNILNSIQICKSSSNYVVPSLSVFLSNFVYLVYHKNVHLL